MLYLDFYIHNQALQVVTHFILNDVNKVIIYKVEVSELDQSVFIPSKFWWLLGASECICDCILHQCFHLSIYPGFQDKIGKFKLLKREYGKCPL